jgi:hypothetical protein
MISEACGTHEKTNSCQVLVGKAEGWRGPGMPKRKLKDNTKTNLQGIRWHGEEWLHQALDRNNRRAAENTSKNL